LISPAPPSHGFRGIFFAAAEFLCLESIEGCGEKLSTLAPSAFQFPKNCAILIIGGLRTNPVF
jgi:hypothetical protein